MVNNEIEEKYPKLADKAVKCPLQFPSTYLVGCAEGTLIDIHTERRCSLDIVGRSDLHLRHTQIIPDIPALTKQRQA